MFYFQAPAYTRSPAGTMYGKDLSYFSERGVAKISFAGMHVAS
jgi:hypothetical protein